MALIKRVVITGMGVVSPLGNTIETLWDNAVAGRSGIRDIQNFDAQGFPVRIAGEVPSFSLEEAGIAPKEAKKMDRFIQYGLAAAKQAVAQAQLPDTLVAPHRYGCMVGSGIGGLATIEQNVLALQKGPKRVSPYFIPASIINMLSGHIAMTYGFQGPNISPVTACATGTHAIAMAARLIALGDVDVMLAGGAEQACTPAGIGGFAAVRALSARNEQPEQASRPWDKDRDGFVLGDGAGVLVLESLEHAQARGATILGELLGSGMTCDAYHMTQPTVEGPAQAIQAALAQAEVPAEAIDYVNAHATSTPIGDKNESHALKQVFGAHLKHLPISGTKSMTGHLLGAAGALEAILTLLALQHQVALPTINMHTFDPDCPDLDVVPNHARPHAMNLALSNSFGFGGTNGALIFKRA